MLALLPRRSRSARLVVAVALGVALFVAACGGLEDGREDGAASAWPPYFPTDDGGGTSSPPREPVPVCFLADSAPRLTAGYEDSSDAGTTDAGSVPRRTNIDVAWPTSHLVIEELGTDGESRLVAPVPQAGEALVASESTRIVVDVPHGATDAWVRVGVSCNAHTYERFTIGLELHADGVEARLLLEH